MYASLKTGITAATLALLGLFPTSSLAANSDAATEDQGLLNAPLATIGKYWDSAWYTVAAWMPGGFGTTTVFTDQFREHTERSEIDFKSMMDAAGYAVKSIKMGAGVLPELSLSFGLKRENSEFDRAYAHRLLRKHARARSGPTAIAERIVLNTILDLQTMPVYEISEVHVTFLPLPSVEFTAEPKATTLDAESSYIVRKIELVNQNLEELH